MQKTIKIIYEIEKKIICGPKEIDFSSMTITAKMIFDLLDYSIGDTYALEPIDFDSLDKKITDYIQPVYKLIDDLIKKINELSNDATLKQKEETFNVKTSLE